jgi:hypothetical protein
VPSSKLVFCFYYCRKGSERRTESESSVVLFEFLFLQLRLLERFLSLFSFTWERRVVQSIKVVFNPTAQEFALLARFGVCIRS